MQCCVDALHCVESILLVLVGPMEGREARHRGTGRIWMYFKNIKILYRFNYIQSIALFNTGTALL